ncbi:MAG: PQQ-binding-like beta-propeller repeat protein [Planctomycetota bacterium]
MRFVPALLMFCLVCVPLAFSLETVPSEQNPPFSLSDLKLNEVSWTLPVGEYSKAAAITWSRIDGKDLFLVDSEHILHSVNMEKGIHNWIIKLPDTPTHAPGISEDCVGVVIRDRMILVKRSNGERYMDQCLHVFPSTTPAVTLSSAFVGVFIEKKLLSVDSGTGLSGWSFKFRDFLTSAPVIFGDAAEKFIYAAANDGAVICIPLKEAKDAPPSKAAWTFNTNGPNTMGITLGGDKAFVPSEDSCLYALNRFTGNVDWKVYTGFPLHDPVQVVDSSVFLKSKAGFHCYDAGTGKEKWTFDAGKEVVGWTKDALYVLTTDKGIALLNMETGEEIAMVMGRGDYKAIPNTAEGMILLQSGTTIFALK